MINEWSHTFNKRWQIYVTMLHGYTMLHCNYTTHWVLKAVGDGRLPTSSHWHQRSCGGGCVVAWWSPWSLKRQQLQNQRLLLHPHQLPWRSTVPSATSRALRWLTFLDHMFNPAVNWSTWSWTPTRLASLASWTSWIELCNVQPIHLSLGLPLSHWSIDHWPLPLLDHIPKVIYVQVQVTNLSICHLSWLSCKKVWRPFALTRFQWCELMVGLLDDQVTTDLTWPLDY